MLTLARLENDTETATGHSVAQPNCGIIECVHNIAGQLSTVAAFRGVRIAFTDESG